MKIKKKRGKVLWDTGATFTVVHKKTIANLELRNVDSAKTVRMANGSEVACPIHYIDIKLSNDITLLKYKVGCFDTGEYMAIIGMDIIGSGSFSINYLLDEKQSVFCFSIDPSICMMRNFQSKVL